MAKIICISGKSGAGKDAVAEMLKTELNNKGQRVLITSFAAPLKQLCKDWFGWDGKHDFAGCALQQCVDNTVRAEAPDFWMNHTLGLISMMRDEWDYVIIPDCQFQSELNMERFGLEPIHIRIEGQEAQPYCMLETDLDDAHANYIIDSSAAIAKLLQSVCEVAESLQQPNKNTHYIVAA